MNVFCKFDLFYCSLTFPFLTFLHIKFCNIFASKHLKVLNWVFRLQLRLKDNQYAEESASARKQYSSSVTELRQTIHR